MRHHPTPTDVELGRLLDTVVAASTGPRDRAILELLLGCGLSTAELARARRNDLAREHLVVHGRGGRVRQVQLTHQATYALERYLATRQDALPHLFVRHDRARSEKATNHLTPRSIQRALERHRRTAGLRHSLTPQSLRRAFTWHALHEGVSVEHLRDSLGHRHLGSTKRLAQDVANELRPATI